jgi:radical SAM protein with 4Fe4S-binding SPASM domain
MAKLSKLEELGADFIVVSLYINYKDVKNAHKARASAKQQIERFFSKLGASYIPLPNSGSLVSARIPTTSIDAVVFVADIARNGNDRGGYLKQFSHNIRRSPCVSPFGRLFIDWSGDVLPCCNLRGDVAEHKSSIMGNVQQHSLMDIYYSKISNQMRQCLASVSSKEGVCKTCQYDCFSSGPLSRHLMAKALRRILN